MKGDGARDQRAALEAVAKRQTAQVRRYVTDGGDLGIVKAPPGSGKTWLLLEAINAARSAKMRVAVAAQTNSQVDSICSRFALMATGFAVTRFAGGGAQPGNFPKGVDWVTETKELPSGPSVVVGTTAKWGLVNITDPYDALLVDEAWQMSWADFMLLGQIAKSFLLIGDPGQIPPVVSIDVARWETAPRPPHLAAPQVIVEDARLKRDEWSLPATRRLPYDAADLVRPFYDFEFGAFAQPGERGVLVGPGGKRPEDRLLDLLRDGSAAALTLPTPDHGPPLEQDVDVAEAAAKLVKTLLSRSAQVTDEDGKRKLNAGDIGLCATHRSMNSALDLSLPRELRGHVRVDTPERWQGLECKVMIVVHPLSGVLRPSAFDLETGRLCVMASRHRAGMIVLARDHLESTLNEFIPNASQAIGRKDVEGRGLCDNLEFWTRLTGRGRVIAA
ncbi:MAG: AAA domain-containing protein [Candidatus Methylomirabilaceae bacterium]